MDLIRVPEGGHALIQGYGDNGFRISGQRIEGAVLVRPGGAESFPVAAFEEISAEHVERLAAGGDIPEIVLIGAGSGPMPLPDDVRAALTEARIAVEVMGTGAACRTFNVLIAEGRRVAAILVPVR